MVGRAKVVRQILAEDTTLHDVHKFVEVELTQLRLMVPRPHFLKDDSEFGVILNLTGSGTIDMKLIPVQKTEVTDEQKKAASEEIKRAKKLGLAPDDTPETVEEVEMSSKSVKAASFDPTLAELDDAGNVKEEKKKSVKKPAAQKKSLRKRLRRSAKKVVRKDK